MADLSGLSDDDLLALYQKKQAEPSTLEKVGDAAGYAARTLDAFPRGAARGTIGVGKFMDELSAFLNTGAGQVGDYGKSLEHQRQYDTQLKEEHPYLSGAGEMTGGVLSTLAALRLGGKAAPGMLGPKALENLAAKSRPARIGTGLAVGSGGGLLEGAVSGFGEGEGGFEKRLASGAEDAFWSSLAGAGGTAMGMLVAKGAPLVYSGIKKAGELTGLGNPDNVSIKGILDTLGLSRENADTFIKAAEADDALRASGAKAPAAGRDNVARAGEEAQVMDTGPNMREVNKDIVATGGPAGRDILRNVNKRVTESEGHVTRALDEGFGEPVGLEIRLKAKRAAEAPELDEEYREAYSRMVTPTKKLQALTKAAVAAEPEAVTRANKMMQLQGFKVPKDPYRSTMFMDYMTRALKDINAEKMGALGGKTDIGKFRADLARDIRDELRLINKDYGVALTKSSDAIEKGKALNYGYDLLSGKIGLDDAQLAVMDTYKDKKYLVGQGMRDYITEKLGNVKKAINDGTVDANQLKKELEMLTTDSAKLKLQMVLPPQQANQLFTRMAQAEASLLLKEGIGAASRKATQRNIANETAALTKDPSKRLSEAVGTGGIQNTAIKAAQVPLKRGRAAQEQVEEQLQQRRAQFVTRKATSKGMEGPLQDLRRVRDLQRMERKAKLRAKGETFLTTTLAAPTIAETMLKQPRRPNRGEE